MCFVYILLLKNLSFYTGHTNNIKVRLNQHHKGFVKFTKNHRPLKLVYFEKCLTKNSALAREKQTKGWSKIKKIKLIKNQL